MFRRLAVFSILMAVFLPSTMVFAASTVPEFDPICWKKQDCLNARATLLGKTWDTLTAEEKKLVDEGFSKNEDPCVGGSEDNPWGKCLPSNVATTEIAFGGQRRFLHIGDFIKTNYNYALSIVGILAAVMMIVAGFQWVTSGGSSEAITSAKKRIGGAVVGLFIAYMSFFILNTINPATVNLRLPQVWLIRQQELTPQFCSAASSTGKFALVPGTDTNDQVSTVKLPDKLDYNLTFHNRIPADANEKNFWCGKRFFVKDSGADTCFGDYCDPGKGCVAFGDDPKQLYYCKEDALMSGKIFSSTIIDPGCLSPVLGGGVAGYYYPYINTTGGIEMLCRRKSAEDSVKVFVDSVFYGGVSSIEVKGNDDKKIQYYAVKLNKKELDKSCNTEGSEVVGYVLQLMLIDHTCGVLPSTWLFGKNGRVLAQVNKEGDKLDALTSSDFFSKDELLKGNILMDIDVLSVPEP